RCRRAGAVPRPAACGRATRPGRASRAVAEAARVAGEGLAVSAVAVDAGQARAALRPMRDGDLDTVMRIELRAYPFPWTVGIFRECLRAASPAWVRVDNQCIIGYGVLSVVAGEAHVLNVCIDPDDQAR